MKFNTIGGLAVSALLIAAPFSAAIAADMAVKAPPAPVPAAAYNWTGFYLGVEGGYAWGSSVQFFTAPPPGGSTNRYNINGWEGGGTLGYNWQIQQWVLGIETDFSGSQINGSTGTTATYSCGTTCATTVNDFGTLRGRLGYAWNNVLLYGTGGWAYGGIASNLDGGTATNWRNGWVAGAGAEYGFAPHWSAKLEWIYLNFNSFQWTNATNANFTCTGLNCSTDAKFSVIRAGVNYRF
jgi:outer membrane immunogenic protein